MAKEMSEREALSLLASELPSAGDDAAVVGDRVLTTDLLRQSGDFPEGTTRYTAGWRAVAASLSDVAAMGATADAAVAAYAAPRLDCEELTAFLRGAREVCTAVDAEYVGGDLDSGGEFTIATTALGTASDPVYRSGASPGDAVCVTGTLGRTAAALRLFARGETDRANALFRFTPRVAAGRALAPSATAMTDASDGLARSLHQIADASGCGFTIDAADLPVSDAVDEVATDQTDRRELSMHVGEDFELVSTLPEPAVVTAKERSPTAITRIGTVTDDRVMIGDEPLADRGYEH